MEISKFLTVQACEKIEWYYSEVAIVFSGRRGFHIHVLDFDHRDWTRYNERNPIKTHEVAHFIFSQLISLQTYTFDRAHFILSVDPMRVVSFPKSLNAETGLICSYIGNRKDLEFQTIENILVKAQPFKELYSYPEPFKEAVKRHA